MEVVGKRRNRIEGIEKVTGEAKFTGDLDIPGALDARVLRSPMPTRAFVPSTWGRH